MGSAWKPKFESADCIMAETALRNADGSLKLDVLAEEAKEDLECVIQHILLHHTQTRPDGTHYVHYGSATKDIAAVVRAMDGSPVPEL